MIRYYALLLFLINSPLVWAQTMHEDASLSYYWKNKLTDGRLYTDNGLGKSIWLKNQPAPWVSAYAFEDFSLQTDGTLKHNLMRNTTKEILRSHAWVPVHNAEFQNNPETLSAEVSLLSGHSPGCSYRAKQGISSQEPIYLGCRYSSAPDQLM